MSQTLSVIIEGDKSNFITKGAIDRFKKDLRSDNTENLMMNDYFKDNWTYELIIKTETECRVKLINKSDYMKVVKDNNVDKRKQLKQKLSEIKKNRVSKGHLKMGFKDSVPKEILDAYIATKSSGIKVPIPDPSEILAKPEEYKQQIQMAIQSFGSLGQNNNPYVNYFRVLAKHFNLPTTFQPPTQPENKFVEQLRMQREDTLNTNINDEMSKIYESLGMTHKVGNTDDTVNVDAEMDEIYKSLGIPK